MNGLKELAEQAGMHYRELEDEFCKANADGVPMEMLEAFAKLIELRYQKKIADLENIICQRHWDVLQEREACAYRAGIALLGADRGLANRVDQAIRARA